MKGVVGLPLLLGAAGLLMTGAVRAWTAGMDALAASAWTAGVFMLGMWSSAEVARWWHARD